MSQEAIELLESIKVVPAEDDSEGNTCCKMKVSDYKKIFQALALLKQPPAGEFTEKCREYLKEFAHSSPLQEMLKEACDLLDRAEASKADLLGIIKIIQDESDKLDARIKDGKHDDAWPKPEYIKDGDWARMLGKKDIYHRVLKLFEAAKSKK